MGEESVGDRIRQARLDLAAARRREVTQVEVGRALGVTGVTVGRWEAGGAEPSLALIRKLADFLETDPRWLAFGAPTPSDSATPVSGTPDYPENRADDLSPHAKEKAAREKRGRRRA